MTAWHRELLRVDISLAGTCVSQRLEAENSGREKTCGFNFPSDSAAVILWVQMSRFFSHFLHLYTRNSLQPAWECRHNGVVASIVTKAMDPLILHT